jgi:hypothetical protein
MDDSNERLKRIRLWEIKRGNYIYYRLIEGN